MAKVIESVAALAAPIAASAGCTLWDVEYLKEGGARYLRVYIDKPGGVFISDCESVSRSLSDALDESDPIKESYILEVSSAGADRALKKSEHFAALMGNRVQVKLYRAIEGKKEHVGELLSYGDDRSVTIGTPAGELKFESKDVALVRLRVDF